MIPGQGRRFAIDEATGKLYLSSSAGIQRSNFDGSNIEDVLPNTDVLSLALDKVGRTIYFGIGPGSQLRWVSVFWPTSTVRRFACADQANDRRCGFRRVAGSSSRFAPEDCYAIESRRGNH